MRALPTCNSPLGVGANRPLLTALGCRAAVFSVLTSWFQHRHKPCIWWTRHSLDKIDIHRNRQPRLQSFNHRTRRNHPDSSSLSIAKISV